MTINQRGNIRRHRKPDITSSRKSTIARLRGSLRTSTSTDTNLGEAKMVDNTEVPRQDSRSAIRSRIRRPPGFRHQLRSNTVYKSKATIVPKSIKRMRIKSHNNKIESSINEQTEKVHPEVNARTIRPPRFRIPTAQKAHSSHISSMKTHNVTPTRRLRNPTGMRGHSTTTTTTTTTTEKITISPNAHQISYTMNDSEYVDMSTPNPIVFVDDMPVVSNNLEDLPLAAELISTVPIPDNVFSQATHQLMKAKKTSSEVFLPTLVPLVRKTPSTTLSNQVPIFEAGTKQSEESSEDITHKILESVKRGRYILAATSNG